MSTSSVSIHRIIIFFLRSWMVDFLASELSSNDIACDSICSNPREWLMEGGMWEDERESHTIDKVLAVLVGLTISIVIWHVARLIW